MLQNISSRGKQLQKNLLIPRYIYILSDAIKGKKLRYKISRVLPTKDTLYSTIIFFVFLNKIYIQKKTMYQILLHAQFYF